MSLSLSLPSSLQLSLTHSLLLSSLQLYLSHSHTLSPPPCSSLSHALSPPPCSSFSLSLSPLLQAALSLTLSPPISSLYPPRSGRLSLSLFLYLSIPLAGSLSLPPSPYKQLTALSQLFYLSPVFFPPLSLDVLSLSLSPPSLDFLPLYHGN